MIRNFSINVNTNRLRMCHWVKQKLRQKVVSKGCEENNKNKFIRAYNRRYKLLENISVTSVVLYFCVILAHWPQFYTSTLLL